MSENSPDEYRLNSFIAKAVGISRRKADEAIKNGAVSIDDKTIIQPGTKVLSSSKVEYLGKMVKLPRKTIWIVMNKPQGYITSRSDPSGRPIVMDLLSPPDTLVEHCI